MGNANRKVVKAVEKVNDKVDNMMNTPCTITEAVQIARGVAEDTITDYHRNQYNVQLSMTIQLELMKDILISAGIITEEEFKGRYMEKVKEIQKMQDDMRAAAAKEDDVDNGVTKMEVTPGDVEVKVEN